MGQLKLPINVRCVDVGTIWTQRLNVQFNPEDESVTGWCLHVSLHTAKSGGSAESGRAAFKVTSRKSDLSHHLPASKTETKVCSFLLLSMLWWQNVYYCAHSAQTYVSHDI